MFVSKKELATGLGLLIITAVVVAGFRWSIIYDSNGISAPEPVSLYLQERTDLPGLINQLEQADVSVNQTHLRWVAQMVGWRTFFPGHYRIDGGGDSYHEFLSKLARGIQDPVSITILPGRMKSRLVESLSSSMQFDSLALQQTLQDTAFLAEQNTTPEGVLGRLYPNTYQVYWTASPETLLKRVLNTFQRTVVDEYRSRLKAIDESMEDILTMASIIEWEAQNDQEKPVISGLYWNRLERDMRLQSDPTINFAVGERRRLHYKDYKVEHPYNTYLHDGLPPGPITNPGLASIKAALFPEEHDYLYMVASPEGSHNFSKTFEEHKEKSAKWRQWLQKQYRIKEQREASGNK